MQEIKNPLLFEEYSKYVSSLRQKELERTIRDEYIASRDFGHRPLYKVKRSVSKDPDFIRQLEEARSSDPVISAFRAGTLQEDEAFVAEYRQYEDILIQSTNPPFNHNKKLFTPFPPAVREMLGNVKNRYQKSRALEYARSIDLPSHIREVVSAAFYSNFEKINFHLKTRNNFIKYLELEKIFDKEDPELTRLDKDTLPVFLLRRVRGELLGMSYVVKHVLRYGTLRSYMTDVMVKSSREDAYYFPHIRDEYFRAMEDLKPELEDGLHKSYPPERCASLFMENEAFAQLVEGYNRRLRAKELLKTEILETIPENLPDLFPNARMLDRKFYLHVGPTNSGKTYESIRDLMDSECGAYLAPLRLLAYEQYENMNDHGVLCSLLTGEEKIVFEDAKHYSSTIEKADFSKKYDCVVIDEAQMMADRDRGGAWTFAILGIAADVVHLCLSPDALQLAINVISSCGDSYEVIYHRRKTPLVFEDKKIRFPDQVERGDALIVFTRKDVHRVAAELQSKKISCSVVYGALPYETRHREAERFARGETQVVVATDAIGMGMNLPIRRVVFMDAAKFDGHDRRLLTVGEVKQIAGRAGRYGIYDEGRVNALYDRKLISSSLKEEIPQLEEAVLGFPELLLKLDMPLSVIMEHWISLPCPPGYVRYDLEEEIFLAKILEKYSDDKEQIYRLVTIPFSENSDVLMALWKELSLRVLDGYSCELRPLIPQPDYHGISSSSDRLGILEEDYHICDLLFNFSEKFELGIYSKDIMEKKREISDAITSILVEQNLRPRKCKRCGKSIAWNYRYGVCQECFERTGYERERSERSGRKKSHGRRSR